MTDTWNLLKPTDESVVTREETQNKAVNATHSLTIQYSIRVPTKDDYQFLPLRLY